MTNEEMAARIDLLEREIAAAEVKLTELRSGTRRVDPAEKAKVDAQYDVYSKEWRLRKRMVLCRSHDNHDDMAWNSARRSWMP